MNDGLFDYPWALLFLFALPVLAFFQWGRWRVRSSPMFFSRTSIFKHLQTSPRVLLKRALPVLRLAALALVIVACARPTLKHREEATVEGIDIYVALDLSGSMQGVDVTDAQLRKYQGAGKEPPNRFNVARSVLEAFVRAREVDRIGMVVFARDAFLQFPLTFDYNTVLTQLHQLELGDIDGSGTAIGNALGRSVAGLKDSDAESKIVILITDGERRGGNISPMQAADFAKDLNINVFPILVGSEGKTRVPRGRNMLTGTISYAYQDYPVNPKLLQDIAKRTGGEFYRATDQKGLAKNLHEILDRYKKTEIEDFANVSRQELFEPLLALAIALLMLELLLNYAFVRPFP